MTTQVDVSSGAEQPRDLVSLNPEDGLFLRAEHLTTIQDYARAITMAVGQAAGTGVVWGLDLRVDEKAGQLVAAPGLAINGQGRPLLSYTSVTADLPTEPAAQDAATGYWIINACYDAELTGRENRYGNLCDDGCGCDGGATIRPFRTERIRLDLLPQSEAGLGDQDPERRRGWLASWYFEQERRSADPWLTRGVEAAPVGSRLDREWYRGPDEPTTACVPLGVLLKIGDGFVLDTWTARRDLGMGYADDAWRWRLGMRPWNVFMAQVLQFQDQLSGFVADLAHPAVAHRAVVDARAPLIERYLARERDREEVRELAEEWAALSEPFAKVDATTSLWDKGFTELPPAGFLPGADTPAELQRRLEALFEDRVGWRVCTTSADAVARAVDHAQHLDRIPLRRAKDLPEVDILVPDRAPDLPALRTEYGWVAFVRRRQVVCSIGIDEVEVYTVEVDPDELRQIYGRGLFDEAFLRKWLTGQELERLGALDYPLDTWEFPGGELVGDLGERDGRVFAILAVPRDASRAPLMALRAQLFAASFTQQALHVAVESREGKELPEPEALVLLVLTPSDGDGQPQPQVALVETSNPVEVARSAATATTLRTVSKAAATKTAASRATAAKAATAKAAPSKTAASKTAVSKSATKKAASKRTTATRKAATGRSSTRKRSSSSGASRA